MKIRGRQAFALAAGLAVLVTLVAGMHRWRAGRAGPTDVLPTFVEAGPGPRSPRTDLFGFRVGASSLQEVQRLIARAGFTCADTSVRALMAEMRAQKRKELEERRARGQATDAVTGASALHRPSPKESNPQVRLSCDVTGDRLGDRTRPAVPGRLLLVFDSPKHPLRHVSYERTFPPALAELAGAEYLTATRDFRGRFGAAAEIDQPAALPLLDVVEGRWSFADLHARVAALNYGSRGVTVSEIVEVPWPVRADAPALAGRLID